MFKMLRSSNRQPTDYIFEEPIRDEIFSPERLEQYALYLANELSVSLEPHKGRSLLPRVEENLDLLKSVYKTLTASVQSGVTISPAAEWLIDNFHIIEDQVREIKEDLPEKYYEELPKITIGELANYPRVYSIALTVVAHQDSHIDIDTLKGFIRQYQTISPLYIGEVWAVAIALRIALVENLRRLAIHIIHAQEVKEWADNYADQILGVKDLSQDKLESFRKTIQKKLTDSKIDDCSLIVHLSRKLRDQTSSVLSICDCLDQHIACKNLNMDQIVHLEYHRQAAAQVTVSNIINSMRLLSNIDWQEFFESVNLIDPILGQDPSRAYEKMDFASRDRYRHIVERIQKKTGVSEVEVAKAALQLAKKSVKNQPQNSRLHHVGYYLIESGIESLEKKIGYQPTLDKVLKRWVLSHPTTIYLNTLFILTFLILAPLVTYAYSQNASPISLVLIALVTLIPISDSCLNLLNLLITRFLKPRILSKLDLDKFTADLPKAFVVVPTIFSSKEAAEKMLDGLEIRYLANQDENLYFALLSDFTDSDSESLPNDESLLKFIETGIEQLNFKYDNGEKRFFVFHRKRLWNEAENKWMGWERKRGKIHEFNRYLRGANDTSFILAPPQSELFKQIKYVITCDSDTRLPRGSAKKLLGTILHPLNQPQFDKKTGRVIQGYGILQPRISITPESSERSWFARIFSGHTGIDPYTTAVSDIYQDLFAEGIYTGKGLYIVDSFENALQNRVPKNTLLSHDLFEGLFARTALVTDIEFLDDYPSHYVAFAKRQHRWTRGDWQILTWLFSKVPDGLGNRIKNSLPFISRWKIFDNLRRSLVAPLTLLWLILGWTLLPGPAVVWTLIAIAILAFPAYAHATNNLLLHPRGIPWTSHFWNVWGDVRTNTTQMVLSITCIPHQAYLQLDAVIRSLYRKHVSHKHLLEWQTAEDVESNLPNGMSRYLLWPPILTSAVLLSFLLFFHPVSIYSAIPFLVLWSFFPIIVQQISKVRLKPQIILEENDILQLRTIARKTWNFFDTFVTEEDNWLIPDNFQEIPKPTVAHRTSPTNMGLLLLSTCSAYDLGYIGSFEMIERLEKTLKTMLKMEKQFGHFYNWYDTKTLQPLFPEYISTVDSGNLAGHLIAVKQSCLALKHKDLFPSQVVNGLHDTIEIVMEKIKLLDLVLRESKSFSPNYLQSQLKVCLDLTQSKSFLFPSSYRQPLFEIVSNLGSALRSVESLEHLHGEDHYQSLKFWLKKSINMCESVQHWIEGTRVLTQEKLNIRCDQLANICNDLVLNMDFSILFNKQRKIFTIGYNVRDGKTDNSYYDLLASESRLASFVAIAKGDVPQSHWFHLGRQMTSVFKQRVLISWSASMFEYLMPLLVMRDYPDTLLNETHYSVVKQQIFYGKKQGIPWGISESGYNARDLQMNYQYGPFGIPGMGLKRGLVDDIVISPYSTALAAIISPKEALNNFKSLIKDKLLTDLGFYEAIDYTSERVQPGQGNAIVQNFMAHHQGMILVAFNNVINDNLMQNRFHQDLMVRSSELLLQERTPKKVTISHPRAEEVHIERSGFFDLQPSLRQITAIDSPYPITQILSNGGYTVMLSAVGSGYSQREEIALTRWHGDASIDRQGFYIYIEDNLSGTYWSSTLQPTNIGSQFYKTTFSEHKAEFLCHKEELVSHVEVIVSTEDNVELRKITLTNFSKHKRNLNITSYLEPILTAQEADLAHPAFNKLFIETDYIKSKSALLAHRRKRSHNDPDIWGIHLVTWSDENKSPIQYETDRSHFLGRGPDLSEPMAIKESRPLSNTVGATLDPIFSLRKQVTLSPQETVYLCFVSGVTESRDEALRLIDQYHDLHAFNREDEMAWTKCQAELRHLNVNFEDAECYQKLGSALLFPNGPLRANKNIAVKNSIPQSSLWTYGVSGDIPILMVKIKSKHEISLIKQLIHAHEYLRLKDIRTDLVVLNAESSSYRQALHDELNHQVRMAGQQALLNKHGGIFLLKEDSTTEKDVLLFKTTARVYLDAEKGPLKDQLNRLSFDLQTTQKNKTQKTFPFTDRKSIPLKIPDLQFYNGYGGFTQDGKEYVLHLKSGKTTPAPWVNVIANDQEFGFLVSEVGSSCTWSKNSRENRITPWSNDPLSDPSGEVFYFHDLESDELWSPTPAPIPGPEAYLVRHGQGYSQFENNNYELKQQLTIFCLMDKEIKVSQLKFKNESPHARKLSVTYYLDLVLGHNRNKMAHHIVTEHKEELNAILAHNAFNEDFGDRITFVSSSENITSFTCDRREFIGRHGNYQHPEGLKKEYLGKAKGANFDPCIAIQVEVALAPKQEKTVSFILGQTSSHDHVHSLLNDIFKKEALNNKLLEVKQYWNKILESLQVQTPFPEFDVLVNRWLLYQNLSCRLWGRTAFYQSGGAFGFRDQLQDVTSLLHTVPDLARRHILKAACHQFIEGDVLHWWHPPTGKGVRTHFSDDLLWLPYVVSTYITVTGDQSILDEIVPFIEGPQLPQDKEDLYFQPKTSQVTGALYEHCIKAIDRSLRFGKHDLPLMGTGDWNDGMNQVGAKGEGESVWMAWFLISILKSFSKFCEQRNDGERKSNYQNHIMKLNEAVETTGWDGQWYKRAYFDDGSPLGSKENDECQLDSLTQSWAALSGTADQAHLKSALNSIKKYLVNDEEQLILLFAPPFDKTALNPGYIKGYIPGVRENGGQYTHAAIWAAQAFATIGDGEVAFKLMSYLSPINHTKSIENVQKYKVEPYVVPADVYTASGHLGRGGWTWYTGSASWFYRAFTESILGIYRRGNRLEINPCLPNTLMEYKIKYKYGSSTYHIQVKNQRGADQSEQAIIIDGKPQEQPFIPLKDENKSYEVQVNIYSQVKRELPEESQMKI